MPDLTPLADAAREILTQPTVWLSVVAASVYGVLMGAVPGLTATMAVALLVPVTYFLPPMEAIAAVVALEASAIFAGDIPGALLRIPGTPSTAAYVDDLHGQTRQGRAREVLGFCLMGSITGGLMGAVLLIFFAPLLARLAMQFTPVEYFWFYVLGLGCAVVVTQGPAAKGVVALMLGLLAASVGLSAAHEQARLTFGLPELYQGINFIPAMIGLFGLSEVLRQLAAGRVGDAAAGSAGDAPEASGLAASLLRPFRRDLGPAVRTLRARPRAVARSGLLGFVIGMLPGAGADIAAWVSYAISKRASRTPEAYGRGSTEGIADATVANNAGLAGAWVPALSFGVPGDTITALLIGILAMKDVRMGPQIFAQQGSLVYGIYLTFILANLLLLPVGLLAIQAGHRVIRTPPQVLLPLIVLFCILGAYATNGSAFDVITMLVAGVLGFVLERRAIPLAPVVLGIVLGGPFEESFVQTLASAPSWFTAFFGRPLAVAIAVAAIALWISPLLRRKPADGV